MNTIDVLTTLGGAATGASSYLSGTPRIAVLGVGTAFTLIGDLISLGYSPTKTLDKLRDIHPDLKRVRDEREALRQQKIRATTP